jgi:endonuclease/exonuclease/phosphatase family metal-dependent hydrolase
MRLATWNCCRGPYEKKAALLDVLRADVAVLQECARPQTESETLLWFGDNPRQGLAVVARGAYRLRRVRRARSVPKYVMPVEVLGPRSFLLFAVWTKTGQEHCYVEAAVRAVYLYRNLIASGPTVLMGDVNSNVIWDHQHPVDRCHTALVNQLSDLGLTSAYHAFFDEAHGKETRTTYYFHWKETKPYHLDYCFIPKDWVPALRKVCVEPYEPWKAHSDHRPLTVDIG